MTGSTDSLADVDRTIVQARALLDDALEPDISWAEIQCARAFAAAAEPDEFRKSLLLAWAAGPCFRAGKAAEAVAAIARGLAASLRWNR